MLTKLVAIIQLLYALIGVVIVFVYDFEHHGSMLVSLGLFSLIPALCAWGTWRYYRPAVIIAMVFFVFQSVRRVGSDALLPHIAPITASFPMGDFASGNGYLIDAFALLMVVLLVLTARSNPPSTDDQASTDDQPKTHNQSAS